jgi:hypothetical protein
MLASGESPKGPGGLVGRDEELGRILALLNASCEWLRVLVGNVAIPGGHPPSTTGSPG